MSRLRIARVFPRRTNATPRDDLAFVGEPGLFPPKVDEVHVSVTFTWDLPLAEGLARAWGRVAPVRLGGPAVGARGGNFEPGKYLRPGYTITSRGCPNKCWFCDVPRREGPLRELAIAEGWNILDNNLLACSEEHIRAVFEMLGRQRSQGRPIQFTGGLEAARLRDWHVALLWALRPRQVFFAFDTADDWEPLEVAARMVFAPGLWTPASHRFRCYVLVGYPGDSVEAANIRLQSTLGLGFVPMAMVMRGKRGEVPSRTWSTLQRLWARPAIIARRSRPEAEGMLAL